MTKKLIELLDNLYLDEDPQDVTLMVHYYVDRFYKEHKEDLKKPMFMRGFEKHRDNFVYIKLKQYYKK